MNRKRQKTLNETFDDALSGEAAEQFTEGTELQTPTTATEIPRISRVMQMTVSNWNAKGALKRVLRNKGANVLNNAQ